MDPVQLLLSEREVADANLGAGGWEDRAGHPARRPAVRRQRPTARTSEERQHRHRFAQRSFAAVTYGGCPEHARVIPRAAPSRRSAYAPRDARSCARCLR